MISRGGHQMEVLRHMPLNELYVWYTDFIDQLEIERGTK